MIKNLIIGTGPAGLAVAGRMRQANIPFEIFEKEKQVGSSWRRHYDRLHLHTVKQWSHLPGMEFPVDYPTYISKDKLIDYFEKYSEKFNIQPQFGKEVISIKKVEKHWQVETNEGIVSAESVVVATGVNRVPNRPTWIGEKQFSGQIVHSADYKNAKPFLNKKVLVVGMGNTGAELALDLSEHGLETFISVRGEIAVVPRDLNGRPVQVTAKLLDKLPFGFGDWLGTQIRKIYFGNLSKYGLKTTNMHPAVLLRETGKTPVVDIGTIKAIKEGKIKVLGDIGSFYENGIQLKTGERVEVDAVILATGYRGKIEDFVENGSDFLDKNGYPKNCIGDGFHKGLFFVGFDNYKLGGILGTIFTDSELVVNEIKS